MPSKRELPSTDDGPDGPAPTAADWRELKHGVERDVRLTRTLDELGGIPLAAFAIIGVLVDTLVRADDEAGTASGTPDESEE